jgi:signal transduction histidine kinase
MRLTVRSSGRKLILIAILTLLLCLLLFSLSGWSLLKLYSEQEARSDALAHLTQMQQAYRTHLVSLGRNLENVTSVANSTPDQLQQELATQAMRNHLATLAIISHDHQLVIQTGMLEMTEKSLTPGMLHLVDAALQGQTTVALQPVTLSGPGSTSTQWMIATAYPLRDKQHVSSRVLLAQQPIDNYFAQDLTQQAETAAFLCVAGRVQATTGATTKTMLVGSQTLSEGQLCTPNSFNTINSTHRYITLAQQTAAQQQLANSQSLVIVAVEPVYGLNLQNSRHMLIMLGLALCIFALGAIIYTLVIRGLFIRPLRRLRLEAEAMIASNTGSAVALPKTDDLTMLSHSFNLLSESLEGESQAMIEQMSNLLIMSDALISTLNLEHLLGEVVSRIGLIMHVEHVSLLLYGREMQAPWAVAQWTEAAFSAEKTAVIHEESPSSTPSRPHQAASVYSSQNGIVTVYADPDGDITLAVTTKMAALPGRKNTPSGKRAAVRATKLEQVEVPYKLRAPRIPRGALRNLDMILARMVIQRKKIAYGEDIATIYEERQESWARLALDSGYRSAIAVPLLLQDQAIGAFILYSDAPYPVSSRDTFLLSTAAIQTAMAIQNAILFAEVKEKNEALQRANHLKSQFLANVTHELRTPLHSIISYGALILEGFVDGELTSEQEEHIQFMVRRAEDLSRLVDDMLDLSKIEADRIEVKLERLDLAHSLTEVVNQLKPLANNKGLHLTLEMEDGTLDVTADGHRLRQVAINLVSNAIKFTEKGGVTIRCHQIKHGEMVNVSVHDTGIGISPAALGYIFEAFRQADGSTTRQFGGTGLGLTIARKLIELQGGEVAVESAPGQGTTFSFTLPVAPALANIAGVR